MERIQGGKIFKRIVKERNMGLKGKIEDVSNANKITLFINVPETLLPVSFGYSGSCSKVLVLDWKSSLCWFRCSDQTFHHLPCHFQLSFLGYFSFAEFQD